MSSVTRTTSKCQLCFPEMFEDLLDVNERLVKDKKPPII